ncbi:M1 family metallopeptidase [Compostibacter hankyongensis]|uniref:M1 family metallopeptidase n=2 Tax=Compostibacter hankyongensis TaxID=1007089 RepID=A0ABP8FTZ7_9BACT
MFFCAAATAQRTYWQQKAEYKMAVKLDVHTNRLTGTEQVTYYNNSPDTLHRIFFHLYWNAFQPGSMMDVRSRELGKIVLGLNEKGDTVRDWDSRVRDRILHLKPDEIGYDSVVTLKMDGRRQEIRYHETILEVLPDRPVLPGSSVRFDLIFKCQVPVQIRRSGRDNAAGVRYSMSQWYPKICEYDYRGWHPTPYIAREFYGVWGDYDVTIDLDKHYLVGGTGYLQNPQQTGYGYAAAGTKVSSPRGGLLSWHFYAPNVHDFMWAADPRYRHLSQTVNNAAQTTLHVIYKKDTASAAAWQEVLKAAVRALPFIEKHFGPYPYKQYSFIQGGDGGMEYPMGTLIAGPSLGTVFHEWMHSWYQMMLGTNESMYPWMDEGFATYAEGKVSYYYYHAYADSVFKDDPKGREITLGKLDKALPLGAADAYRGYFSLVESGLAEPMTTHADHYETNFAYGQNAYSKGAVFLEQLGYITGAQVRDSILMQYYRKWRFKHPDPNDFMRVAEKVSGMQLDWYQEYWINTTKTIDYGIEDLKNEDGHAQITLRRIGEMPMPVDLLVRYKDGHTEMHYIPLYEMFGTKPREDSAGRRIVHKPWRWTNPVYHLSLPDSVSAISSIEIDPSQRMADTGRGDNRVSGGIIIGRARHPKADLVN